MSNKNKKTGIIYKATSPNGKVYIGQTIRKLEIRKMFHFYSANNVNNEAFNAKFSRAIRKYGIDNFIWKVIENDITIELLNDKEINVIKKYDSSNNGYNSTHGGEGTIGRKLSKKQIKEMSMRFSGKNNPFYGRHHSEKTKKMLSEINTGKVLSKKTRDKISSNTSKKLFYVLLLDAKLVGKYKNIAEAGRKYNVYPTQILRCIRIKIDKVGAKKEQEKVIFLFMLANLEE